jgi:excisionase family DNA binding protein
MGHCIGRVGEIRENEQDRAGKNLLTARDVAAILKIKITTVYEWASQGIIPSYKLNRGRRKTVWRFSGEEIDAWLRERKNKGKKVL